MGALSVVVSTPAFDQHFSLIQGVEDLPVEQLISEFANERLHVTVLPGTARLNEQSLDIQSL